MCPGKENLLPGAFLRPTIAPLRLHQFLSRNVGEGLATPGGTTLQTGMHQCKTAKTTKIAVGEGFYPSRRVPSNSPRGFVKTMAPTARAGQSPAPTT